MMRYINHAQRFCLMLVLMIGISLIVSLPAQAGGGILYVTSTDDSGIGTLREAILEANRRFSIDPIRIVFQIDSPRPYIIRLQSALPEITQPVIIDGESQCATSDAPSVMRVVIDGSDVPSGDGLYFDSGAIGSMVRGLSIIHFADGAGIYADGVADMIIACNHIGVDATGETAGANNGGVYVTGRDIRLMVGGSEIGDRNIISGNTGYGIRSTAMTIAQQNFIGTNAAGTRAIPNSLSGIFIEQTGQLQANLVSGNGEMGILIDGAMDTTLIGNLVGTDATGTRPIPNTFSGVYIRDSHTVSVVDSNLISGNTEMGILINASNQVTVAGNYIGTDVNGAVALPNGFSGIGISGGAFDVTIGGELGVNGNVISGNTQIGIRISEENTRNIIVMGNLIGTDPTGTYAIPNGFSGVYIRAGARDNIIGTGQYAQRNIISGNGQSGVVMNAAGGNRVQGNFIGTDISGTYAIGNQFSGISIENGASNNRIGGDFPGAGNLISGNNELGIFVTDAGTNGNYIFGNFIGVDITGTSAIGNAFSGIGVFDGATNTTIGGLLPAERNLISGNGQFGIAFSGAGANGLVVMNNLIGTDEAGAVAIPNAFGGIVVESGARNARIGGDTPEARNIISGNQFSGVAVRNAGSGDVTIIGNFIGADVTGQLPLPNAVNGVRLSDNADTVQIGDEARGMGNLIAFNTSHGVYVDGVTGLSIVGNAILSNDGAGIFFANGAGDAMLGRNDFKRNCSAPPQNMGTCEDVVGYR